MANIVKFWQRKGFYYYAYIHINRRGSYGTIQKRLDFITYHFIRLIYGEGKLMDIAARYKNFNDL